MITEDFARMRGQSLRDQETASADTATGCGRGGGRRHYPWEPAGRPPWL